MSPRCKQNAMQKMLCECLQVGEFKKYVGGERRLGSAHYLPICELGQM